MDHEAGTGPDPSSSSKRLVGAVYVLGIFVSLLDLTVTNVALPRLAGLYGAPPAAIAWVATGYLLSVAVAIPVSGWLGDRFGTKRTFIAALALFTLGSFLCGVAWDLTSLVGFRVLQGIGGGLLGPVGAAMVLRAFPLAERARASALLTMPAVVAPALGPLVGGYLVQEASWRWIFLLNVPLGLVGLVLAGRGLHEYRAVDAGPLDLPGFALAAVGLPSLVFALGEVGGRGAADPLVLGTGATGLVALAGFAAVELRIARPLIDLRLYKDRLFAAGSAVLFCANAGFFGVVFLLPQLLQGERGYGPLASGLATFPTALGIMAAAPVAGRLYPTIGPRRLMMAGLTLAVVVALAFRGVGVDAGPWSVRALVLAMGIAFGLVFVPLQAASFAGIGAAATGQATAAYNAVRQLATGVGVALLASMLSARLAIHEVTLGGPAPGVVSAAFGDAFAVAAGLNLLGLGAALLIQDRLAAATMVSAAAPGPRPMMAAVE